MPLEWLELRDFRSYAELSFCPEPGLNVLVGDNGTGKTSILEAIGYLSRLRSFRRCPDAALVRSGATEAIVRGGFGRDQGEVTVEIALPRGGRRRVLLNGKRPRRLAAISAELPVVAFLPDDLDLVKRGPALRREYVDDLVATVSPSGGAHQVEYARVVRQRNTLLRTAGREADPAVLDVWDERVGALGAKVIAARLGEIVALEPQLAAAYLEVAAGGGEVHWSYVPGGWHEPWGVRLEAGTDPGTIEHRLREALRLRRRRDLEERTTTVGPHRDDPTILLDGRDIRTRASQGEQRSVALGLRLASYRRIEERLRQPPLLLLDDVFSELDPSRSDGVVSLLPRGQVFVTTAREDEVPVAGTTWEVSGADVRHRGHR